MLTIRDILTGRKPVTLPGRATVLEAARAMKEERVGAVVVLDAQRGPKGCFTERDLMTRVVVEGRDPASTRIEEVMTTELFVAPPEGHVNEFARQMQTRHIRHLPVVEKGKLIGMLSLRDLLRAHLDTKRHEVQALQAYIKGDTQA